MEDYWNILWLLLAIGSLVFSIIKKREDAKQKSLAEKHPNSSDHGEALPEHEPYKPLSEFPQHTFSEIESTVQPYKAARLEPAKSDSPHISHPTSEVDLHGSNKEHSEAITSDFDLRKAVIWSEILKPKFDEDSH